MQRKHAMVMARWILIGAAAFVVGATAPGAVPVAQGGQNMPLRPLTDQDEQSTQETGCTFTFSASGKDYLQLIGSELMLRDQRQLQSCRLGEKAVEDFENGRGAVTCAGYGLRILPKGRSTSNTATDSSGGPAVLTVDQNGTTTSIRGVWGVAC
jgi:hypothetical protein